MSNFFIVKQRLTAANPSATGASTLVRKLLPSRRGRGRLFVPVLLLSLAAHAYAATLDLSKADARSIGRRIWQNECNGTVAGLTSWNAGEDFASLGIGHFIWYPSGVRGPFEESFPDLVRFISAQGAKLPPLLDSSAKLDCPWSTRAEFQHALSSASMKQLRTFLADTVDLQARFLVQRLQNALPKILEAAPAGEHATLQQRFYRVASTPQGCYALVDYVNFKGEGVLQTEQYQGKGWGLLQVLQTMRDGNGSPQGAFAQAAAETLRRRVRLSPSARHEARWLPGWLNRVATYTKG